MAERPRDFPPVHVAMVRAGEKGGFLEKVLARLCAMVKSQEWLKSQIVGSLVYPVILGTFGTLILLILFIFFVPDFRQTLEKLGGELPAVTRIVFGISDILTKYGLVTVSMLICGAVGGFFAMRKPAVRSAIETFRIKAPILGKLSRAYATSRLCQLLGSMLDNGVPMLTALHIAKDGVGNAVMKQAVEQAAESVKTGQNLATPLEQSRLFDDDVIEMIRMGEAANNLDEVLLKVSETIETRLSAGLSIATKLIEPAVLVSIGFVVMVVAFALILPMMNATANL
jgi:general secretion pathway protein F/type IV pilus assembly protein PilC